jgi:predicted membrane protein
MIRSGGAGPVLALLVLAPWAAECSWGGFPVQDLPLVVVFLGPVYGGAAVLIRETVRRTGGGWPVTALLAAAFGIVQAGLVDQSLFNRQFLDDTQFAEQGRAAAGTLVPGTGVSAGQFLDFVGNHVVLSICVPIMLVEALVGPERRRRPWLGRRGLAGVAALYVLGSLLIFADDGGRKGFLLSPAQAVSAAALVLALVGVAMLPRWRREPRRRPGPVPGPLVLGCVVLAAHLVTWSVSGWPGVGLRLAVTGLVVAGVLTWSRRPGWGRRHVVAGWSAGLLAAVAGAWIAPTYAPTSPASAVLGDAAVTAVALVLVTAAHRRARAEDRAAGVRT